MAEDPQTTLMRAAGPAARGRLALRLSDDVIALSRRAIARGFPELSERQWGDVVGVLRVQRTLDVDFLLTWAKALDVEVVLDRALTEAGYPRG